MRPSAAKPPRANPDQARGGDHTSRTIYALIFFLTLVAYLPTLHAGYIWDDAGHVTRPALLSLSGLWQIWTKLGATQQYYPVVHTAFWLEHHLWGDAPFGYHLINLLEHALAACLLVAILRKLRVLGAGLAGLIFALTPVAVESVAWVSEQKNTLSAVFYLASALLYLTYTEDRAPRHYWQATLCFLLAVFTKSVTATLPAALLLILWWRQGPLTRKTVVPLLPWFLAAALAALLTTHVEHAFIGAQTADTHLHPVQRLLLLTTAPWFYLLKLLWPDPLIFIYPKWKLDPTDALSWVLPLLTLALLAAVIIRLRRRSDGPVASSPRSAAESSRRTLPRSSLTALLYFGGTLLPALGLTDIYPFRYSYVADHFQYLASLGLIVPFAWLLAKLPNGTAKSPVPKLIAVTLLVLVYLSLTFRQSTTYRDEQTLWQTTLDRNPSAWLAETNLGTLLVAQGQVPAALEHFSRALALAPNVPETLNSYGDALNKSGRPADAVPQLQHAIAVAPKSAEAHNNLGVSYMMLNESTPGIPQFEAAVALNPAYATAERNLGLALATAGHAAESLPHFARAATLDPRDAEAQMDWGIALAVQDHMQEAAPHLEAAITLNPTSAEAHAKYAMILRSLNRIPEAEEEQAKAQSLSHAP